MTEMTEMTEAVSEENEVNQVNKLLKTPKKRKTNAEKKQEIEQRAKKYEEKCKSEYLDKLMDALETASKLDFKISVKAKYFVVCEVQSCYEWVLPASYDECAHEDLLSLIYALERVTNTRNALEEIRNKKKAALAKLTKEEQLLLKGTI